MGWGIDPVVREGVGWGPPTAAVVAADDQPVAPRVAGRGWFVWAVGVIPIMFILPMYVFPLPTDPPVGAYDGRRLIEILWAAGLLLAFLRPRLRSAAASIWSQLSLPTRMAAGFFLSWALLSALLSAAPAYALREWSLMTLLLIVSLPLAAILAPRGGKILEVVGLSLVLYAILVGASPLDHGFSHARFLGQALAVISPAVLFSGSRILAFMAAPAVAVGIVNGSRALMLTLVVVTVLAAVLWPDRRRRMAPALMGIAVAILLVALFSALGHQGALQEAAERVTSSTGRVSMWTDAFGQFARAPLFGVGPGLLARVPGLAGWAAHPHNSVLLVAAETGIPGLAAVFILLAQGARQIPGLRSHRRPWALALLSGAIHSLFSGTVVMPASQAMLILVLAAVLPAQEPQLAGRASRRATGWILAGLGAAALLVLLATLTLPGQVVPGQLQGPRFFSPGTLP